MAAEKLRDLSQPIDVPLLDATVAAFYGTGSKEERSAADQILRELQNNPDAWLQVVHILQNSQNLNTKFFALQKFEIFSITDNLNRLDVRLSEMAHEEVLQLEFMLLGIVLEGVIKYRWNVLPVEQRDGIKNYISDVIVQVLKHEWPARWRTFIPDLVSAAKSSETICENCMAILKLLSEEVFDFSRGEMTQQKIKELKQSLNSEFQLIHELCLYVLSASQRMELIRATLATLHAFLSWIPLGYIFESPLVGAVLETLLKFFPVPAYRNLTLQCLTEVAALQFGDFYDLQYVKMYTIFMVQLQSILPPGTNIPDAYANGSSEEQCHIRILESTPENRAALLMGLEYLIGISYADDTEVFKVCLDYWNALVLELFESHHNLDNPTATAGMMGLQVSNTDFGQVPLLSGMVDGPGSQLSQRRQLYAGTMSKLRMLMICRMAKPEEVLIVEDENGNIVRETMKDNDVLVQYKLNIVVAHGNDSLRFLDDIGEIDDPNIMRETLIYLCHLDHEDTEQQMLKKLSKQLNGEDWTWNNLNTLCWAIGSISGSMMEDQGSLLYVVGQYPKFLRAHWKFLKTVVNKLFEFMHETHPGVQDMACDTFLKIVQKCKRKFVIVQVSENEPFVSELLTGLPTTIADLEPHQIHSFYESVGHMIQAESDPQKRDEYLQRLMDLPNQKWAEIIGQARQDVNILKDPDIIRTVLNILQTNTSVASSLGTYFFPQISLIFLDMLNVYRMYSELISNTIAGGGPFASKTSVVKLLRSVKRETLKLIETFVDKAEDQPQIGKQFVPPMMDPILGDYARNLPDARESEVLSLFATIINKYKGVMIEDVPRIFEAVFECTLQQLKLVMDSIIWAFRHTERNIAETGLNLLLEMLKNFQVDSGSLTEPLWDSATVPYPYPNNMMFVQEYIIKLLGTSFPNMTTAEVTQFVNGLFESRTDLSVFKNHIRDFLAQSKEFSAQDNKDLYAEEAAAQKERERQRMLSIPGLIAPNELHDEMVDS
ncbi:Exportin-1 [Asimina triloba]